MKDKITPYIGSQSLINDRTIQAGIYLTDRVEVAE